MTLGTMYPPQKDSPSTSLLGDILGTDTQIYVTNASVLPSVFPYPLTMGYDKPSTEVVIVTAADTVANRLTVTRSGGSSWPAGTKVARVFNSADLLTLQQNVALLESRANHTGTQAINTVSGLQTALDAKAPLVSPSFTGPITLPTVVNATTQAADNNTTLVATTAFAKKEADDAQAFAIQRANHTGSQAISTIISLQTTLDGKQPLDADLTAIAGLSGTSGFLKKTAADTWALDTSAFITAEGAPVQTVAGRAGNVVLAKGDVGLGNVENTTDLEKVVSTATQNALDLKLDKNTAITGATKTKITYDADGLITAGADATQDDIGAGATYGRMTLTNITDLTDAGDSALHYHSTDRNRTNHTGTQLASTVSDFAATVRSTVLTGLAAGTNATIAATDQLLAALAKLQAQVSARVTGVTGTAPIVSSGGMAPVISINAATQSLAGSMSAADKTKVDRLLGSLQTKIARFYPTTNSPTVNGWQILSTYSNADAQTAAGTLVTLSGNAYTLTVAGWWLIHFGAILQPVSASSDNVGCCIELNNSAITDPIGQIALKDSNIGPRRVETTIIRKFALNDVIRLGAYIGGGTNPTGYAGYAGRANEVVFQWLGD